MALIDRYILKTAAVPVSISLLIAAFLLILEQMLRLLDFVLHENGPVDVIWRMLAYLIPHYLSLALPLSAFLGTVLAVRKLSQSSELDAAMATGFAPGRLMRPLMAVTGVLMVLNFIILAYIQPYARYEFHQLRYELQAGLLGARVPVGKFVNVADGVRLRIGRIEDEGAVLHDIFVSLRLEDTDDRSVFTAKRGQFVKAAAGDALILRLMNGRQMVTKTGLPSPGVLTFEEQDLTIDLPDVEAFRLRGGEQREATIDELYQLMTEGPSDPELTAGPYRASFHFRIIHTLTFLSLPMLAMALGSVDRRRPRQAGPILGLGMVILYHELLEEWAAFQVEEGLANPYMVMWPLFAAFVALSLILYLKAYERPGGIRYGWLDKFSAGLLSFKDFALGLLASERGKP